MSDKTSFHCEWVVLQRQALITLQGPWHHPRGRCLNLEVNKGFSGARDTSGIAVGGSQLSDSKKVTKACELVS
jgi:hypothetical protein